jgi:hypothetical protein
MLIWRPLAKHLITVERHRSAPFCPDKMLRKRTPDEHDKRVLKTV